MQIIPIKTRVVMPPKDDIYQVIDETNLTLREQDVLIITSKIVAIHQGRCILANEVSDKKELIKKEADAYIHKKDNYEGSGIISLKGNTLTSASGIDESNANGYYILWPENPSQEAENICKHLKNKFNLNKLAVIITDSNSMPLRYGVSGIAIGFYGLEPLKDYKEKKDIFGREFKYVKVNIPDALASIGVFVMGEGNEQQPMAIARGAKNIKFINRKANKDLFVPLKEDKFYPLLTVFEK